jgi:hypothetical protein
VNRVIASAKPNPGQVLGGELWILSKKKLKRYDGSFRDYKKAVRKSLDTGTDFGDT